VGRGGTFFPRRERVLSSQVEKGFSNNLEEKGGKNSHPQIVEKGGGRFFSTKEERRGKGRAVRVPSSGFKKKKKKTNARGGRHMRGVREGYHTVQGRRREEYLLPKKEKSAVSILKGVGGERTSSIFYQ